MLRSIIIFEVLLNSKLCHSFIFERHISGLRDEGVFKMPLTDVGLIGVLDIR